MKTKFRSVLYDTAAIVGGSFLLAAGLIMFTVPSNIAPGGVSGLATALAHLIPLGVGVWSLLLNVPLMLVGWWVIGWKPLMKTIAATVLLLTRRPSGAKVLRRLLVLLAACYTLLGFLMYGSMAFGWYRWLGAFGYIGLDLSQFLMTSLACTLFSFGWYCYFRRSKRVKAYFSPLETDRLKEQEENGCKR